ncbi:hypothetical protein H0E87_030306 [Populus deltoides]|uniref:Uncharacterized protein n=1 Tax=Populus deltoides TaxID=3696 RepID=A0A8T2WJA7_POPDE|nr:hypothetical protein H0E87_030306 [Populus deltoides]
MKNVSRNKSLLCFKPVVNVDQLLLDHSKVGVVVHSNIQALKLLGRRKKEDMKRLVSNSSFLSDDNRRCSAIISSSKNSLILHHPKKNFSRIIKAVFFETILSKRVRDRKGSQCQDHSNGSKHISSSSPMNSKRTLDDTSDHHDNTDHQVNEANLRKKESKDQYYYEKKVIMAGLLERKQQRFNDIKFLT